MNSPELKYSYKLIEKAENITTSETENERGNHLYNVLNSAT